MKLSDQDATNIANLLVGSLLDRIGVHNLKKVAHERVISEIVEMMDDLEDRVDSIVASELVKSQPQKTSLNAQWWSNE